MDENLTTRRYRKPHGYRGRRRPNRLSGKASATREPRADEDVNANHGRGQLLNVGAAGAGFSSFEITSFSFQKQNNVTYVNDLLTIFVFEGTAAQWGTGTGHTTAANGAASAGGDVYAGTTVTPLYSETVTLNGAINNNNWITFNLNTPLTVGDNADIGFLFVYEQIGGASNDIDHYENSPAGGGGRIALTTTGHAVPGSRSMDHVLQGTATPVPKPSTDLLGCSGTPFPPLPRS
ncbi:hypothetical protein N9F36_03005 [Akkermansiaceae bacterium]|nr:hypothetical protein [Akkermansiaceae bacterium]